MRIGFINDQPRYSGMGAYAFNLFEELKKLCDIDHIFLDYDKKTIKRIDSSRSDNLETEPIAKTFHLPLFDRKVFFWERIGDKIPKYDLYHFADQNMSFLAKGRKAIVTCCDISHCIERQNLIDFYTRRCLYLGFKFADRLIVISKHTRKDIVKFIGIPKHKIKVIYLGVHSRYKQRNSLSVRKKLNLPLDKKIILHVGTRDKRKNVSTLIKAFYILQKRMNNVILLRRGPERTENIELIKKLHIAHRIQFIDFVPGDEIPFYYNAADLLVFPSTYEGFGLPTLEAMASGCPVIAARATSIPEVVGDAAILTEPYDVDSIAENMFKVLNNNVLREELVRKGLERAKLFTWKKVALETLKYYKEV